MSLEFKNILERINGDPQRAAAIIFELGLSADDLADPAKNGRVFDVINYLMKEQNPSYQIHKLTSGKVGIDKIDHIWTYYGVREKFDAVKAKLSEVSKSSAEIEAKLMGGNATPADHAYAGILAKEKVATESEFNTLVDELNYF